MKEHIIVEALFPEVLREALAEKNADYDEGTTYAGLAWIVVSRLHAACIGAENGSRAYTKEGHLLNGPQDSETRHKEMVSGLKDLDLLHRVGFTEAMEREAFRQLLAEELASHPCEGKLWEMEKDDSSSRNHYQQRRYHRCADWAYRYTMVFKGHYLECVEDLAKCDEDMIAERLK